MINPMIEAHSFPSSHGTARRGFTLVELLVVITIIGILMSLLLPAVQSARESARSVQCSNNVKQLALGCLEHVAQTGFFPSGGWGEEVGGDPDCGFGIRQPGGWLYSVLPFIDQKNLWSLGQGTVADSSTKKAAMTLQISTPLIMISCPSRRRPGLWPTGFQPMNIQLNSTGTVARSDYAANAGDTNTDEINGGPPSMAAGNSPTYAWASTTTLTGISFQRSTITPGHMVAKGASNEYMIGEKYLNPTDYYTGADPGDNEWCTAGFDNDLFRTAGVGYSDTPLQDMAGLQNKYAWGCPHPNGIRMAFCDGSVHVISFTIDPNMHAHLANRNCTVAIDPTKF